MSDIANDLGISKRTLYEIFRDKDELLDTCFNEHITKIDKEVEVLVGNSEDVIDAIMQIYARHLNEMHNINKTLLRDLKKYHLHVYKKIEHGQRTRSHTFLPLLKKGVEQGLIRKDVNFEIILWLVKSQFRALMGDEYIPTDKYSTEEFIRAIILNFIRGIATPYGNEKIDTMIEKLKTKDI